MRLKTIVPVWHRLPLSPALGIRHDARNRCTDVYNAASSTLTLHAVAGPCPFRRWRGGPPARIHCMLYAIKTFRPVNR